MKNAKISILLLATALGFGMYSCQKDGLSEEDAMKLAETNTIITDSLSKSKVEYSVTVLDASTSLLKSASTNSIQNSTITITQNGSTLAVKVDTTAGIATFKNLRMGSANVSIKCPGYYDVNYIVTLSSGNAKVSNLIAMLPSTATQFSTISGKVTYERDLTNLTPENATGINVVALIDPASDLLSKMTTSTNITSFSYGGISLNTTTDNEGNYSIKVPVSLNELKYTVRVADFTVKQKLLFHNLNGVTIDKVDSVPTVFGFVNGATATTVLTDAPSAIVTIDAPTTATAATATAVVDNSNGVNDINITNVGANYGPGTYTVAVDGQIITDYPSATYLNPAIAQFAVNTFGRITTVKITSQGGSYAIVDGSKITLPYVLNNNYATIRVTSVDASGKITGATVMNPGSYTTNAATNISFILSAGTGSGAVLTPSFYWNGSSYSIGSVSITSAGSGYATNNTFTGSIATNSSANQMAGNLHLTKGSLSAINITNQGKYYAGNGNVDVVITDATGIGASATAHVTTDGTGRIDYITVDNAGSGFTAPTITLVNKSRQAKASFTISNGIVTNVALTDAGAGYYTIPNVTITPTIANVGSGASLRANINTSGQISGITVVNGGAGYIAKNTFVKGSNPTVNDAVITTAATVKSGTNAVMNVYLGTGYRSINQ